MMGKCKSLERAIPSIIIMLLWMLSLNVFLCAEKLLADEIVESAVPSIVQIHIYAETGELWCRGSGFFIAPGKILTCEHVMEDAYSARIVTSIRTYNQVKILKMNKYMDLALLEIIPGGEEYLEIENKQVPIRDQYLIAIGYDFKDKKDAVSYGIVHSVVNDEGYEAIVNSAHIVPGWSGGPLLNLDGNVIGVHKYYYGDGPGLAMSTGMETIKEFLEGLYYPKDLAYAGSSELLTADLKKFGEFWEPFFDWIDRPYAFCVLFLESFIESHVVWGPFLRWINGAAASIGETIPLYLFVRGLWRGIYIIILIGILVSWRIPFLVKSIKAGRERKATNKIVKWRDGDGSLEKRAALKAPSNKAKHLSPVDGMGKKAALDRKSVKGKKVAHLEEVQS